MLLVACQINISQSWVSPVSCYNIFPTNIKLNWRYQWLHSTCSSSLNHNLAIFMILQCMSNTVKPKLALIFPTLLMKTQEQWHTYYVQKNFRSLVQLISRLKRQIYKEMNCCHLLPAYLIPAHQWVMLQIGLLWWKILNIFILNNPNLTVTWKNRGNVSRYFRKITTQRSFWSFSQHLINHVSCRTKYHLWFLFVFF